MGELLSTTEQPDFFRLVLARNDLATIAVNAAEQVAVHQYATQAASEVLERTARTDVPNREKLIDLKLQHEKPSPTQEEVKGKSNLVRRIIAPETVVHAGVSERDVTRDVLSKVHPDRAECSGVTIDDEQVFKAVTEARQNEDNVLVQGLYAGTVASRATEVESPSPSTLEKVRYKAWLALQAGRGRFDSRAEVDAWKEQELELMPYRVRAGLMGMTMELFAQSSE